MDKNSREMTILVTEIDDNNSIDRLVLLKTFSYIDTLVLAFDCERQYVNKFVDCQKPRRVGRSDWGSSRDQWQDWVSQSGSISTVVCIGGFFI